MGSSSNGFCNNIEVEEEGKKTPEGGKNEMNTSVTTLPNNNIVQIKKKYLIWIDAKVDDKEITSYINNYLKDYFFISPCKDIESGINEIKNLRFKDTYIILSGWVYKDFILKFQEILKELYIIPKLIIFTGSKNKFLEYNSDIENIIKNNYYNLGGIQTFFDEIYDFLLKNSWKKKINVDIISIAGNLGKQFTFEYIDTLDKLYLPCFYKSLIKLNKNDKFEELTQYLYDKYSKIDTINELLSQIEGLSDIPNELLCKYYARLYTLESDFYSDINKILRLEKTDGLQSEFINRRIMLYIKLLFEGIKLGCFSFSFDEQLYRFQFLENFEIELIQKYLKTKKEKLPSSICFSKSFLSFSKCREEALKFYLDKTNNSLCPTLFIIVKNEKNNLSLATHIDLNNILNYTSEQEILFFPFSCFEILNIKESKIKEVDGYDIKLSYLGKYEGKLEKLKKEIIISNSQFKEQFAQYGIIENINLDKISI